MPEHPVPGAAAPGDDSEFFEIANFALQTTARMLAEDGGLDAPTDRAAATGVGAAAGGTDVFDFDAQHRVFRGVADEFTYRGAGGDMPLGAALVDSGAPVFDAGGMMGPGFGKAQYGAPSRMDDVATKVDAFAMLAESFIPPALPPPPYPLERHSYAMAGTVPDALRCIEAALRDTLVDQKFVQAECRWECVLVNSGKRTVFHVRLHKTSEGFCLEFQRRQGCSIVFNMAVSGVLNHIAKATRAPLASFRRSEADKTPLPAPGFFVASFDIPDVPLDLGFALDFTGGPLVAVDAKEAAAEAAATAAVSADLHQEAIDGVNVLLDMAGSDMPDMAAEGTAGLATLSSAAGRDALLSDACVAKVVAATVRALKHDDLNVRASGATLLANIAEDRRSHAALADAPVLDTIMATATTPHNVATAHVRRECLRSMSHLAQGPQAKTLVARGAAVCAATVLASCGDARMQLSATLVQRALRAE